MRNPKLAVLDGLVGTWKLTMSDAWFLDSPEDEVFGTAVIEWLGEGFLLVRMQLDGWMDLVIGRSDSRDAYLAFYSDDRGVGRAFEMGYDGDNWMLLREDPDFFQRFVADLEPDRIEARWEASEDEGRSWRKDYDLLFERAED